jgi:hypothetical protein
VVGREFIVCGMIETCGKMHQDWSEKFKFSQTGALEQIPEFLLFIHKNVEYLKKYQ